MIHHKTFKLCRLPCQTLGTSWNHSGDTPSLYVGQTRGKRWISLHELFRKLERPVWSFCHELTTSQTAVIQQSYSSVAQKNFSATLQNHVYAFIHHFPVVGTTCLRNCPIVQVTNCHVSYQQRYLAEFAFFVAAMSWPYLCCAGCWVFLAQNLHLRRSFYHLDQCSRSFLRTKCNSLWRRTGLVVGLRWEYTQGCAALSTKHLPRYSRAAPIAFQHLYAFVQTSALIRTSYTSSVPCYHSFWSPNCFVTIHGQCIWKHNVRQASLVKIIKRDIPKEACLHQRRFESWRRNIRCQNSQNGWTIKAQQERWLE